MKILFLITISLLVGFASHESFAETEMTGALQILVSEGPESNAQPYSFWFIPDGTNEFYKLDSSALPSNILDWAEERVKVTINDSSEALAETSLNQNEQFLDITSIEVIEPAEGIALSHDPPTLRSVTLLNKYADIPATPVEDQGTGPGQFNDPRGVAVDSAGNYYVADRANSRIQKFDTNGDFVFQFGTNGLRDGQLLAPTGIAVDINGNIYVVDSNNFRVQKYDSTGKFLLKFGTSGTGDGEFAAFPFGVDVDSLGNSVYVADSNNHRIQKFDSSGVFQGWMGQCTSGVNCNVPLQRSNGFSCTAVTCSVSACSGVQGGFCSPRDVAVDTSDNVYVADSGVSRIQKFDSSGSFLGSFGSAGTAEKFFGVPAGVTVDSSGNIYVADTNNHRIQKFDSSFNHVLMWGWGVQDGTVAFQTCTTGCQIGLAGSGVGQLDSPEGIAFGSVYVGDTGNNRIKKFNDLNGSFISEIGSDTTLSHDSTYYQDLFYDDAESLKNYYDVSSYGHYIFDGAVSDWQTLSKNQASYLVDANLLVTDAIIAHGAIDFCNPTPVTNILLVANGVVVPGGGSAFGTLGTPATLWPTNGDGCSIQIAISWLPDNGEGFCCGQNSEGGIGTPAHELGHNIGFEHTPPPPGNWVATGPYNDPYHDPWSIMSANTDNDGPSPVVMPHRDKAGWVDLGNKDEVTDGNAETITLDFSNEAQGGVNPQMITVPLPDTSQYIIEGQKEGIFSDTPQDKSGVVIYKEFPGGNQYPYLTFSPADKDAKYSLVATAGTDTLSDFDEAVLEVGESFEDLANSVTITVLSEDATSVTVSVSNNAGSPCSPPAGLDWVISADCTLTGNVTADKNITVQNNSVLTIPTGMTVFFDPATFSITVIDGSGILVQGSIQTTP